VQAHVAGILYLVFRWYDHGKAKFKDAPGRKTVSLSAAFTTLKDTRNGFGTLPLTPFFRVLARMCQTKNKHKYLLVCKELSHRFAYIVYAND